MTDIGGRRSIRLEDFDYSQEGAYFVTICTHNRTLLFEQYSALRQIVLTNWTGLPNRFPFINLDTFVIMPNHLHGIVVISQERPYITAGSLPDEREMSGMEFQESVTLGRVIGAFKSLCTKDWRHHCLIQRLSAEMRLWQRNYYEHIIRNDRELIQIREYIIENPLKWELDPDNPSNFTL